MSDFGLPDPTWDCDPSRGRCETLEGKRPVETFEVPGEMCVPLSEAVGSGRKC